MQVALTYLHSPRLRRRFGQVQDTNALEVATSEQTCGADYTSYDVNHPQIGCRGRDPMKSR